MYASMRPLFQPILALVGSLAVGGCAVTGSGASTPNHEGGAAREAAVRVHAQPAPLKLLVIGHSVKGRAILARVD